MKFKLSRISKKTIIGTFIAGGFSLIITMLFMFFFYLPQLHENANNILKTSSHETIQAITEAINDLVDYTTFVGDYKPLS